MTKPQMWVWVFCWQLTWWIHGVFLLIQRFLLTKHWFEFGCQRRFFLTLALRQENNSLYLTWQWDRDFSLFHLSFDLLGTESRRLSFFWKGCREDEQNEVQATDKEDRHDRRKETDLRDEERHKGLHCSLHHHLHQLPLSLRGELTECVYMHCGN